MMKALHKLFAKALMLIALVAIAMPVLAQTEAAKPRVKASGALHDNPSFIGIKVGMVERTADPVEIDSNDQGLLYAICRQSESTDDYALAWDYFTSLTPLNAYIGLDMSVAEEAANFSSIISPYAYGNAVDSTATDYIKRNAMEGCWIPPWPARYESGLIGMNNSAEGYSLFYYRSDDGSNPF